MKTYPALRLEFPDTATPPPGHGDLDLCDAVQGVLLDFPITAIDEGLLQASPVVWRVYFPDAASRDAAAARLRERFADRLGIAALDVADEDWAARSQASLRAIRVGDIVVAPPWDVPAFARSASARPIVIIIEPSMGFGTGHHATTRLCLDALQHLDLSGADVIDVGTGSGVLAIAARRLGASRVLAIDDDEDAIQAARSNLALNPGADVTLGVVDLRRATLRPVDLVIANLTGGLLISAAAPLKALSRGRLVLSGFMTGEAGDVLAAFGGWTVERRAQEDEWGCATLSIAAS